MKKDQPQPRQHGFRIRKDADSPQAEEQSPASSLQKADDPLTRLGNLPHTYGENCIILMAQEPHGLFVYWDFDISRHPGGRLFLRSCDAASHVETEVEVSFESRNWHLPAAHANAHYFVELGYYRGEQWHSIGRSNSVQTPPEQISADDSLDYAALPLHISFQNMLEQLAQYKKPDEALISALSRLREEGKLEGMDSILFPGDDGIGQLLLATLLGEELSKPLSSGALSSGEIKERLQKKFSESINSASSGEFLALAGQTLSSGQFSQFLSSWNKTTFSSWVQQALSSWSEAALSSWTQGALSSFSMASLSSWGGSSSWETARGFFMHVNAEVIFYGGTDRAAKVWVDGKPITLQPDGTFRYHFCFPDKDHEISIVAESPDGAERRSATLHLNRRTDKTAGVDVTAQPSHLTDPMGGKS